MSRVLYVATEPSAGMVPFAAALINDATAKDAHIYAVSVSGLGFDYESLISGKVTLCNIPYPENKLIRTFHKFFPINIFHAIKNIVMREEIDELWLLTGEYGLTMCFAHVLKRLCKVVFMVHDLEPHPDNDYSIKNLFFSNFFKFMTRKAIRVYDNLVTCSKSQFDTLKTRFQHKDVQFIPFPSMVTENMKSDSQQCPELDSEEKFILFFGRVDYYKGVDILYNAFLDSAASDKYKLVIAGKGGFMFDRRKDEKNVIRINRFIEDPEVSWLFQHASAVVYPYRQATMSGVLTIAHYFKTPAIASDVPFFAENACGDDVLFEKGNGVDLCSKLNNL